MARPTLGHLDSQFLCIMDDVNRMLRDVFATDHEMTFPVSATGSGGMQAAVANVVEAGDTVVVGVNGMFGGRIAESARRLGAHVVPVEAPWGEIVPPERMIEALRANPSARVVALVHAETSTGVWQPLSEVGSAVAETDALFLVDAVTSLAGVPVGVDANHVDVCYSGGQKCLGMPPGLAPITFSPKAMARARGRAEPCTSWYFDVTLIAGYLGGERSYHHTAPINLIYGLHEALRCVFEEGLEARFDRHQAVGGALQHALVERGFSLFAQYGHRLPQLTSAALPAGFEEGPLRRALLERHGIEVGGGLGPGKGRLWRIGLMGAGATMESVDVLLEAIDDLLGAGAP